MGFLVSAVRSKQADLVIISQCLLRNIADRRKFPYAVIRLVDKNMKHLPQYILNANAIIPEYSGKKNAEIHSVLFAYFNVKENDVTYLPASHLRTAFRSTDAP